MTTGLRTIIPAALLVVLAAAQTPAWEGETPEWMPGGNLMTELRASGIHVGFVPGDAFFPVRIDDSQTFTEAIPNFTDGTLSFPHEQELSDDPRQNFVEYGYQYPDMVKTDPPSPLGRPGFGYARIFNLTNEYEKILREFDTCLRLEEEEISVTEGKTYNWGDIEGKPQVSIVIVNRDFDFKKYRSYVRYNENWNDEEPKFPTKMANFSNNYGVWPRHYRPHLLTAEAVLEDWQNGPRVPPLKVVLPAIEEISKFLSKEESSKIASTIEIDFKDVAFVGYPTADLQKIFTRPLNSTFYVATYEGVHRYRWVFSTKDVERKLVKEVVYERGQPDEE